MKFLIIDDSQEMVDTLSLCFQLEWPDSEVFSANSGRRGVEIVEEQAPDLVILDISLADITGLEVLRSVRAISGVPVVIHSARGNDVEIAGFLHAGADDYVVKPFEYTDLMQRIAAIFNRSADRIGAASGAVASR